MTLEIIQAKRAALLAECERAKGAIQALDDLIAEVAADQERRKALEAEAYLRERAREDAYISSIVAISFPPTYCTPDGLANCEAWAIGSRCPTCPASVPLASESPPMSPPSPPEMFSRVVEVVPEFENCMHCGAPDSCRTYGGCRLADHVLFDEDEAPGGIVK